MPLRYMLDDKNGVTVLQGSTTKRSDDKHSPKAAGRSPMQPTTHMRSSPWPGFLRGRTLALTAQGGKRRRKKTEGAGLSHLCGQGSRQWLANERLADASLHAPGRQPVQRQPHSSWKSLSYSRLAGVPDPPATLPVQNGGRTFNLLAFFLQDLQLGLSSLLNLIHAENFLSFPPAHQSLGNYLNVRKI
jgi:hypothetical protein